MIKIDYRLADKTYTLADDVPMTLDIDPIPTGKIEYKELLAFINAFPALLWRIDLVNNKIEYLNEYRLTPLDANSGLLLQNVAFRRRFVIEEDLYLLDNFMEAVRAGKTAATLFRLKPINDTIQWVKVTGVADKKNPRYYYGFMLDVTDTAGIVQSISESDAEKDAMIEFVDHPALLLDAHTKTVMAHNVASRDLFLYKPAQFSRLKFSDLCHKSVENHISRIIEEAVFEKKWEGRLLFQRKSRTVFAGDVAIRPYYFKGHLVLRVSIHHITTDDESLKNISESHSLLAKKTHPLRKQIDALSGKVGEEKDIQKVLRILLDNQPADRQFDAIIYSDIYATRKKVVVYTAGKPFEPLPQGEVFPYEGTIAENIDRFKLEHLIVEDTFASIKAIDWALFVPHGIRSYFAKAFYERKLMRSVLILCSVNRNFFSNAGLDGYELYYEPFLKGLKNWRTAQKNTRKK